MLERESNRSASERPTNGCRMRLFSGIGLIGFEAPRIPPLPSPDYPCSTQWATATPGSPTPPKQLRNSHWGAPSLLGNPGSANRPSKPEYRVNCWTSIDFDLDKAVESCMSSEVRVPATGPSLRRNPEACCLLGLACNHDSSSRFASESSGHEAESV